MGSIVKLFKTTILPCPHYRGWNSILITFKPSTNDIKKVVVLRDQIVGDVIGTFIKYDASPLEIKYLDCDKFTYEVSMHAFDGSKRGDIVDHINIKNAKTKDMIK